MLKLRVYNLIVQTVEKVVTQQGNEDYLLRVVFVTFSGLHAQTRF